MEIGRTRWIAIVVGSTITTLISLVIVQVFGIPQWWILALALPFGIIQGWNLDRIIAWIKR